jgi:dCTP deaminase
MNFWSGETLKDRLPELLGEYYDPARIDCAAYRLCVGEEIYISPREGEDLSRTKRQLKPGEAFTIPAGQFAFLLTEEIIAIPPDALGFISIRAKIKFRGLVNISGFHVDPGYRGRLLFSVFNASPAPVHLQRGQEVFLLWFSSLDKKSAIIRKPGDGYFNIPVELINPIAGEVQSLAGLATKLTDTERQLSDKLTALESRVEDRVHRIQQDHTYLKGGVYTLIGLLVFIAGRLIWAWVGGIVEPMQDTSEDRTISAPAPAVPTPSVTVPPTVPPAPAMPQPAPVPQQAAPENQAPRGRGAQ